MPCHERFDARSDLQPVAGAVEDAIMPDPRLKMVLLLPSRQVRRKIERCNRLATSGDVVLLPLDGHESTAVDRLQVHRSAPVPHQPSGQQMVDEHCLQRLEVIFGRQVHDGQILIIELAVLFRRVTVAFDEVIEHLPMGRDMAIRVHRHESAELHEAWIDHAAPDPETDLVQDGCSGA